MKYAIAQTSGKQFLVKPGQWYDIDFINNGKVVHPMIGISLIDETNFEKNKNLVKVGYVVPNSPAQKSGILVNDIILKVGNKEIKTASDVITQVSENGINKKSILKFTRGRNSRVKGFKKAIVTLKKGQSIDLTTGI